MSQIDEALIRRDVEDCSAEEGAASAEDERSEESNREARKRCVKKACCILPFVACAPLAFLFSWLVLGLLSGTGGPEDLKQPFVDVAPLRSVPIDQISGSGPFILGVAPLPEALRGVFWLTDQSRSSALMSFGGPNGDEVENGGRGCSTGQPAKTFCIRVSGDRVWSLVSSALAWLYAFHDIRYIFTLDDAENPTFAKIDPFSDWHGYLPGYNLFFFAKFDMSLVEGGLLEYNGSVAWLRRSYLPFGIVKDYYLLQVLTEAGERIEPAWSKFVKYEHEEVGTDVIHYRSYEA